MLCIDIGLVEIDLRPKAVVARRRCVGSGDNGKNAASVGERCLDIYRAVTELMAQRALPGVRFGVRIIEKPAPDARPIGIFLPIPAGHQRFIGIGGAIARYA